MSIQNLRSGTTAATLIAHPLRPQILANAREPISASDLARHLGQPRQRVNYHVRLLAGTGLLVSAGQQRKRNMVEQLYVASARAYVLSPELLGRAGALHEPAHETSSAAQLLGLCARAQSEVADVMESASAAGVRLRALSMQRDVAFATAEQRADFMRELADVIADTVAKHSVPFIHDREKNSELRRFRLLVGCYPAPYGT